MSTVSNLSPLAFEVLKFLCNTNDDSYQAITKDTFGIEQQKDFIAAIKELSDENLIVTTGYSSNATDSGEDTYSKSMVADNNDTANSGTISAKINDNNGDICTDMDYFIEAQRDTNV